MRGVLAIAVAGLMVPVAGAAEAEYRPGPAELAGIFTDLADMRRAKEVEAALAAFNTRKGTAIGLDASNWRELVEELARFGYLARRGGLPSGRGGLTTDPEGRVSSTRVGSRADSRSWPEPVRRFLAPGAGPVAGPGVLAGAIAAGGDPGLEFGLWFLDPAEAVARWPELGPALAAARGAWAIDGVLAWAGRVLDAGVALPGEGLVPALRRIEGRGEPAQRWQARAVLVRLGERRFEALPEEELEEVLYRVATGRLPSEAALGALSPLGEAADARLAALVRGRADAAVGLGVALAPALAGPATLGELVACLDDGALAGWHPRIREALGKRGR